MKNPYGLRFKHISAAGTTTIGTAGSETELVTVNVNTAAASSTATIYNGASANNDIVAVIDTTVVQSKGYGVLCRSGLVIVVAGGNPDLTIGYA